MISRGYVNLSDDDIITASVEQVQDLQTAAPEDLQIEFYHWCSEQNLKSRSRRLAWVQNNSLGATFHTRDPWRPDTRFVQWNPFRDFFHRLSPFKRYVAF
mmetsp:Transcript_86571/g.143381  ORF Transcript_86571/g.143381 Transcript_86571/m.143381 type:complete len:100 (-) Transcript_86571:30-329(-)